MDMKGGQWSWNMVVLFVYCVTALVLWAPVLDAFFIFDDISTLAQASPLGGKSLSDCWELMGNGFWRPLPLSVYWLVIYVMGPIAWPTHVVMVLFHATNALLVFHIASLLGWSKGWQFAAGAAFLIHFSTFTGVSSLQTLMDVSLTTAFLSALLVSAGGIRGGRFVALCFLFAIAAMCKETAVVFPIIVFAGWFVMWRPRHPDYPRGKHALLFSVLLVLAGVYALVSLKLQMNAPSYVAEGRLTLNPVSVFRQWADYMFSAAFPYVHLAEMPIRRIVLSNSILWILRLIVAGAGALLVFYTWKSRDFLPVALFLCACAIIAPACLLRTPPEGRYLYPALPFVSLLGTLILKRCSEKWKVPAYTAAFILAALFLTGFFASPSVKGYVSTARDVELFVKEIQRISPEWKPGSQIAIFDHPHPGSPPWRWAYCQQLFDLFVPAARAGLALDAITEETRHAYRFEGGRLIELPLASPPVSE